MVKKRYYLAYGSNLNVEQMQWRCPGARAVGTAEIKDYRLLFKGAKTGSHLTIESAEGESVPVGIWEVVDIHEKQLDRYEGFPVYYYKKEIEVDMNLWRKEKPVKKKAFVYIMHEDHLMGVPSRSYIETCVKGYDDFGFDPQKLVDACVFSHEHAGKAS